MWGGRTHSVVFIEDLKFLIFRLVERTPKSGRAILAERGVIPKRHGTQPSSLMRSRKVAVMANICFQRLKVN